jgi:hypothetical protein
MAGIPPGYLACRWPVADAPLRPYKCFAVQSVFAIRVNSRDSRKTVSLRSLRLALNPNYRTADLGRKITGQKNGEAFTRIAPIGTD